VFCEGLQFSSPLPSHGRFFFVIKPFSSDHSLGNTPPRRRRSALPSPSGIFSLRRRRSVFFHPPSFETIQRRFFSLPPSRFERFSDPPPPPSSKSNPSLRAPRWPSPTQDKMDTLCGLFFTLSCEGADESPAAREPPSALRFFSFFGVAGDLMRKPKHPSPFLRRRARQSTSLPCKFPPLKQVLFSPIPG